MANWISLGKLPAHKYYIMQSNEPNLFLKVSQICLQEKRFVWDSCMNWLPKSIDDVELRTC